MTNQLKLSIKKEKKLKEVEEQKKIRLKKCSKQNRHQIKLENGDKMEIDLSEQSVESVVKSILLRATETKHNGKIYIQTGEFRKLLGIVTELQHNFHKSQ